MTCQGGTYAVYSPECHSAWQHVGRSQYPDMHVWVEAIGQHMFESDRDLYTDIPLNVKISGNASSAVGNVSIPVSPMDPKWYAEACQTVGTMIGRKNVELRDSINQEISDLDIHELGNVGQVNVYVDGVRHLASRVPRIPRVASPYKQSQLQEWYETHHDALCSVVADKMHTWSAQEVQSHMEDGGLLEQEVCKFLERNADGPDGESWPKIVATYGMDRLARDTDPHRTAQTIAKELVSSLCSMLGASKEQVRAFYATQRKKSQPKTPSRINFLAGDNSLNDGLETDQWESAHDMYSELAIDTFDNPALRDHVAMIIHRQPGARKTQRLKQLVDRNGVRIASDIGNPWQEHLVESHHPYYGTHSLDAKRCTMGTTIPL